MNNTDLAKGLINSNKLEEAERILLGLKDKYSVFELARLRQISGKRYRGREIIFKNSSNISGNKRTDRK